MEIVRFDCISSFPATMKAKEYEINGKVYDESIVDTSAYSPIEEELAKVQPMTQSEINQHFDFVDGKDDGRKMPRRRGADISEISTSLREANEKLQADIKKAAEAQAKEAQHKAEIDKIMKS